MHPDMQVAGAGRSGNQLQWDVDRVSSALPSVSVIRVPLWSYSLVLVGVSVMMTWGVNIARFSVLTAVVMHAAFNTVSRFLNGLFAGAELRTNIPFEVVFPASGLFVALLLVVITRGRLAHQKPQSG